MLLPDSKMSPGVAVPITWSSLIAQWGLGSPAGIMEELAATHFRREPVPEVSRVDSGLPIQKVLRNTGWYPFLKCLLYAWTASPNASE